MKKLLISMSLFPFAITACGGGSGSSNNNTNQDNNNNQDNGNNNGNNNGGSDTNQPTDTLVQDVIYQYPDIVGDAWTKKYYQSDMNVINKLWKSTVSFFAENYVNGDTYCNDLFAGTTSYGNIAQPEDGADIAYGNKATDPDLNEADATIYTVKPEGEKTYLSNGTGWVIGQNSTHYYIATNKHVIKQNATSNKSCLGVADVHGGQAASRVDTTVGNNGVIWDGKTTANKNIDFAVVAIKKSGFNVNLDTIKLSNDIVKQSNFTNDLIFVGEYLRNNTLYNASFPYGTKRYNKARSTDESDIGGFESGLSSTEDFPSFEFEMYGAGGSSGSPVVNKNNELVFLNTLGVAVPSRLKNNDWWTQYRNAGVPAYILKNILTSEICVSVSNMDSCN